MSLRPFALVGTRDQWLRGSHEATYVDDAGVVSLDWVDASPRDAVAAVEPPPAAGMAFDAQCRLYRSLPAEGRIERLRWGGDWSVAVGAGAAPAAIDLFGPVPRTTLGEFRGAPEAAPPLREPRGLAVDANDRLFVAEAGQRRLIVFDIWARRLVKRIDLAPHVPLDIAVCGTVVYALSDSPDAIRVVTAHGVREAADLPGDVETPSRLALGPDGVFALLEQARSDAARVRLLEIDPDSDGRRLRTVWLATVARATDVVFERPGVIVVARFPDDDFVRYAYSRLPPTQLPPLRACGYDGMGIARAPDGRIAFWTDLGLRFAVPARMRYLPRGRVTTFVLDGGEYQTAWGRLFLDACIPRDTEVRVHCQTTDDLPEQDLLPRRSPARLDSEELQKTLLRLDLSPMPPLALVPDEDAIDGLLHAREVGRELPWSEPPLSDPFRTYEAPIDAEPGRYLWVSLALRGNTARTPRVRSLRAEYPGHEHLRRLPRTFSRNEQVAAFLRRFLAMFDGFFADLTGRAVGRHALVRSDSAPDDVLPWLAGFVGLVMDERWPIAAKRTLICDAPWLFRFRGTVPGLRRFIEIYVDGSHATRSARRSYRRGPGPPCAYGPGHLAVPIIIIEHFKLGGLGGALLGDRPPSTTSVLGAGFRIGAAIGSEVHPPPEGAESAVEPGAVHRFTVIIPAALTEEQIDVVRHVLAVHRPAHTVFDLCTVGAGMRVGRGLHVGLSSMVGRTGAFVPYQLGETTLGRTAVLGRPGPAVRPGASRLGRDSEVG